MKGCRRSLRTLRWRNCARRFLTVNDTGRFIAISRGGRWRRVCRVTRHFFAENELPTWDAKVINTLNGFLARNQKRRGPSPELITLPVVAPALVRCGDP